MIRSTSEVHNEFLTSDQKYIYLIKHNCLIAVAVDIFMIAFE